RWRAWLRGRGRGKERAGVRRRLGRKAGANRKRTIEPHQSEQQTSRKAWPKSHGGSSRFWGSRDETGDGLLGKMSRGRGAETEVAERTEGRRGWTNRRDRDAPGRGADDFDDGGRQRGRADLLAQLTRGPGVVMVQRQHGRPRDEQGGEQQEHRFAHDPKPSTTEGPCRPGWRCRACRPITEGWPPPCPSSSPPLPC